MHTLCVHARDDPVQIHCETTLYLFTSVGGLQGGLCMAANSSCKILNVAEKNDAAKALSNIMSGGRARKVGQLVPVIAAAFFDGLNILLS